MDTFSLFISRRRRRNGDRPHCFCSTTPSPRSLPIRRPARERGNTALKANPPSHRCSPRHSAPAMAPKQGKAAQNSAASASQAASKNTKGAKKKKWSKGKVRCASRISALLLFIPLRSPLPYSTALRRASRKACSARLERTPAPPPTLLEFIAAVPSSRYDSNARRCWHSCFLTAR